MTKQQRNFRLSDDAQASIATIRQRYNVSSDTAAIEMAVKFLALQLLPLKIESNRTTAPRRAGRTAKAAKEQTK